MTSNNTNTNALSEKSYGCESEAGMRHIGFYLDGLGLTAVGKKAGMTCIKVVHLKLKLNDNGSLEIVENMEIGNE
jgi:hypothetical protein